MKNIKKIFMVLLAMLAVFSFAACSDDDDEDDDDGSVSMTFTLSDASTYILDGKTVTSGIYFSNDVKIDGETGKFFFWLDISDKNNMTWMFGMVNDDTNTSSLIPLIPFYKGYFTEVVPKDTLNRTHYYDLDADEWKSSTKLAWKIITTSSTGKTFPFTLTKSDITELEKLFPKE